MGYLSDGGGSTSEGSAEANATAEAAAEAPPTEGAAPEGTGEQLQINEPAPRTERVEMPGRRGKAAAKTSALETQLKTLTETITQTNQANAAALAARDAQIAELRGGMGAIAPFLQQRQQAASPPPPDSAALMREAKKLLDANDFDGYQAKYKEAITADIMAQIPRQQPAPAPVAGPNPMIMAMMSQFPAVVNNGERGMQLAIIEDQRLAVMGVQPGPERFRKAFELASNQLAPQQGAQYSQDSRQVLSGTPTSRPSGGANSRGEGVTLNDFELKWAEAAGMTKEEYAKYLVESDPKRLER